MNRIFGVFILFALLFSSCEKQEGVGGSAKISGRLTLERYNDDFSLLVESLPAKDEKVYIQYGDNKVVADDVETTPYGYFEFNYLYEGDYTIFYYSKDSTELNGDKKEVLLNVSLSKGESKDLGEIKVFESLDFDDGKASISGKVFEVTFTSSSRWPNLIVEDTLMATEKEIYLRYGNHSYYDERIRTQEDGSFYFNRLIPGEYTIYVFSEDKEKGTDQSIAVMQTITVNENESTIYPLSDFFIYKL